MVSHHCHCLSNYGNTGAFASYSAMCAKFALASLLDVELVCLAQDRS